MLLDPGPEEDAAGDAEQSNGGTDSEHHANPRENKEYGHLSLFVYFLKPLKSGFLSNQDPSLIRTPH